MASPSHPLAAELAAQLAGIVGEAHLLTDPETRAPFETDWTRRFQGEAVAVVRPSSTAEVSGVLAACAAAGAAVVPQGGNTGLVGGGVPGPGVAGREVTDRQPAGRQAAGTVVLSTSRLDSIGAIDTTANQVTAGAGTALARLQSAASSAGLSFAVDLAARDSCTVGGMVATNAGGIHVLRYGAMRAQVVGLEAVLAGGEVVSRLSGLVKDNTGYDLSQLLVGSEGTLAVVTAARLRLVPRHAERVVALLGLPDTAAALGLLDAVRRRCESLQAAEIFYAEGLALVRDYAGLPAPFGNAWPVYLLIECGGLRDPSDELFDALAAVEVADEATAVASDPAGMARLWSYRERHTEAVSSIGVPHKLDVTLPQARLADFELAVRKVVESVAPGSQLVLFGHIGDGNLHVNVVGPPPEDETLDAAVFELVASMEGSISAEHGIGRAKAAWLHLSRSSEEMAAMRSLKAALDPDGLLNPGVLFA